MGDASTPTSALFGHVDYDCMREVDEVPAVGHIDWQWVLFELLLRVRLLGELMGCALKLPVRIASLEHATCWKWILDHNQQHSVQCLVLVYTSCVHRLCKDQAAVPRLTTGMFAGCLTEGTSRLLVL